MAASPTGWPAGHSRRAGRCLNVGRCARWVTLLVVVACGPMPGFGADGGLSAPVKHMLASSPAAAAAPAPPPSTLRFFNRDIVTFRAVYQGYSPTERATSGAQRVRDAVAKKGPGTVKMVNVPEGLTTPASRTCSTSTACRSCRPITGSILPRPSSCRRSGGSNRLRPARRIRPGAVRDAGIWARHRRHWRSIGGTVSPRGVACARLS